MNISIRVILKALGIGWLAVALIFGAGCTIKTPEVSFTSERTALEKQILGSYQTIEQDAWMIASVRSSEQVDTTIAQSRRRVLEAFANRRFNADDIADFKSDEVVGENAQGLLSLRPNSRYQQDPDYRALVDRVLAEENRDRKIIMSRIVEVNSNVNPLDQDAVAQVFAQMNQDASPSGTWIEKEAGRWVRK